VTEPATAENTPVGIIRTVLVMAGLRQVETTIRQDDDTWKEHVNRVEIDTSDDQVMLRLSVTYPGDAEVERFERGGRDIDEALAAYSRWVASTAAQALAREGYTIDEEALANDRTVVVQSATSEEK